MAILEYLKQYMDAADVDPKTLEAVAKVSRLKEYEVGDIVFHADQESDRMYLVTKGQVDVQYLLKSGMRKTIDTLGPGDFLVWSAVVKPHTTFSIAICRVKTELVVVEAEALRELCEKDTRFGYRLVSQLARVIRRRLQAARLQLADLEERAG